MIHPFIGMALVLTGLGGLLLVAAELHRRQWLVAELTRKLVHVGMGLVVLPFPWLFHESWPVIILGGLAVITLLVVRLLPTWRQRIGNALYSVARESFGEIYFTLAVVIVFMLARGEPMLFVVPILILALADSIAALVGMRYGATHYTTLDGRKSAEGSGAFFIVAFLSCHLPLLLFTDVGHTESLLIGLTLGLLVTLLEAIAWRGLDNLFIPLGSLVLLKAYLTLDATDLGVHLGVAVALVAFVLGWRGRTLLNDSALLTAALVGYTSWALGGLRWLALPLVMFLVYLLLLTPRRVFAADRVYDVRAVASATLPALLWLFLAVTLVRPDYFYLAALAYAAYLGMSTLAWTRHHVPAMPAGRKLAGAALAGAGVLLPLYWVLDGLPAHGLWLALAGAGLVISALCASQWWPPRRDDYPADAPRWWRQGGIAFLVSLSGMIPLALFT